MNWPEVLAIIAPLIAFMGWVYNRIEKKSEERHREALRRFEILETRLTGLEMRLTRLEGRFDERGYWESREWLKTGTEDKK